MSQLGKPRRCPEKFGGFELILVDFFCCAELPYVPILLASERAEPLVTRFGDLPNLELGFSRNCKSAVVRIPAFEFSVKGRKIDTQEFGGLPSVVVYLLKNFEDVLLFEL